MTKKQRSFSKTLLSWGLQIGALLLIYWLLSWWQERHLLNHQPNPSAPPIQAVSLQGELHQLPVAGQKTLLYFFAPWCSICDISIGNIESNKQHLLEEQYAVYYVALSWQSESEVRQFVVDNELSFPVLLAPQSVAETYQVKGFPTYYVVDEQAQVVAGSQGYSTALGIWLRSLQD